MRIPCPTCKRLGKIPKAFPDGTVLAYCGPNGEACPYEVCQTCGGEGWIEDRSGQVEFPARN